MQVEVDLRLRQETGFEVGAASWRLEFVTLLFFGFFLYFSWIFCDSFFSFVLCETV